jgi:hypothetical protein
MYFLTIEPIEYLSGTNNKQPSIMDKVKEGFGLGENKAGENLSSITNVIDEFKQNELNQPVVEPQEQPTIQPSVPKEEPLNMSMTEDFYSKKE